MLLIGSNVCAGKDAEHSVDNVGTVPAALTIYLACQQYKPDLIISVGTAGGFRAQGAAIGDVFVGTTTVNHDRRIPIPVLQTGCQGMLSFKLGMLPFIPESCLPAPPVASDCSLQACCASVIFVQGSSFECLHFMQDGCASAACL